MPKKGGEYYLNTIPIMDSKAYISTTVKSNGIWQFRCWLEREKRFYSKSLRTRDIDEAQSKARDEYIRVMADQQEGRKQYGLTFGEAVDEWMKYQEDRVQGKFITPARYTTLRSQTKHILSYFELNYNKKVKIGSVKPADFYDYPLYRKRMDRSPQDVTIRNETTTIGSIIKFCHRRRYLPFDHLEFPEMKMKEVIRRDTFTLDEYEQLYLYMRRNEWLRPDLENNTSSNMKSAMRRQFFRDMCLIGANTTMRVGELAQIKWENVDFVQQGKNEYVKVHIPAEITKTRKTRDIVTRGGEFFRRIQTYSNFLDKEDLVFVDNVKGTSLSKSDRHRMWGDLMKGAGFTKWKERRLTFYSLRHFGITSRLYAGVSVYEVAKEAGTSVKHIEDHYEHLDVNKLLKNASASFKVDERGVLHRFDRDENS
jgi:integrase